MSPSYVLGNSWQINCLTAEERSALDCEPWVFVCNLFPTYWHLAGFRPTVWVLGDTTGPEQCQILREQLSAIERSPSLRERLRHVFICSESSEAERVLESIPFAFTRYRRGHHLQRGQLMARSLNESLFHYCSTLTDLINLAWILNPTGQVRLFGCQYHTHPAHFYDPPPTDSVLEPSFDRFTRRLWEGIASLQQQGITIIDCNRSHGGDLPTRLGIPYEPAFISQ